MIKKMDYSKIILSVVALMSGGTLAISGSDTTKQDIAVIQEKQKGYDKKFKKLDSVPQDITEIKTNQKHFAEKLDKQDKKMDKLIELIENKK